ncbi:MAG TPA: DUF2298 domain-containing protein, partial [Anaerolineaceae bacterium]|nr:DUF2298 domain-containing protein [Anaerolineaceae bacterium]
TSPTLSKTRILRAILELVFFIGLSFAFLIPFNLGFLQGYTQIQPWQGSHVNLTSYLVHWGVFVFVLSIWLLKIK